MTGIQPHVVESSFLCGFAAGTVLGAATSSSRASISGSSSASSTVASSTVRAVSRDGSDINIAGQANAVNGGVAIDNIEAIGSGNSEIQATSQTYADGAIAITDTVITASNTSPDRSC